MDETTRELINLIKDLQRSEESTQSVLNGIPTERLENALQYLEEYASEFDLEQIKKQGD